MAPYRRLKPSERQEIIGAAIHRVPLKDVANRLNIPYVTAKRTKQMAEKRDPEQHDLKCSGRPRYSTPAADQRLYRRIKIDTSMLWSEILELSQLSKNTLRRRFKEIDSDWRKHLKKWRPYLKPIEAQKRRLYYRAYRSWKAEDWANVWWTDECSIQIGSGETRKWAWRHSGEQWLPKNIAIKGRNLENVMIWAAMRADGRLKWRFFDEYYTNGRTATAEAYCKLLKDVLPDIYEPG